MESIYIMGSDGVVYHGHSGSPEAQAFPTEGIHGGGMGHACSPEAQAFPTEGIHGGGYGACMLP